MYESGTSGSLTWQGELATFTYYTDAGHPLGQSHVSAAQFGVILDIFRYYMGKVKIANNNYGY
jgi:hypothetical protein